MKHALAIAWALGLSVLAFPHFVAAEENKSADQWRAPDQPKWTNITDNVLASETKHGLGADKVAPPVAVDRTTGRVYIYGQGNGGVLMASSDAGNTFIKLEQPLKSWGFIYFTPVSISPDGGRLAIFASRGGLSLDEGKTWSVFSEGPKWGLEQASVNWREDGRMVLAREHSCDNKNKLFLSLDTGRTWNDLGNTNSTCNLGLLPTGTIVTQQGSPDDRGSHPVNRSEDRGKTWTAHPVPDDPIASGAKHGVQFVYSVVTFKNVPYWLSCSGVYTTKDDGKTWAVVGKPFPENIAGKEHFPVQGPMFGKDENHILMMLSDQFIETVDGGEHWHPLMPTPQKVPSWYACAFAGYDPTRDILYFSMRHTADAHEWVQNHIYRAELKRETKKTP
jgi:hypothetical protein